MNKSIKLKYISSAVMLIVAMIVVKIISALYKIPLTSFIGATGRGYFAVSYNIFMPIHIITMGSLPVALSSLVSRYNSNNNRLMLSALKISSYKLFLLVGVIGSIIVLIFSFPYCKYIAKSPNSIYTVLALIPVVLFSTLSGSYRGFFEGFMNMVPTSVSQTIDAIVKAAFGIFFAKLSMMYLYNGYLSKTISMFDNVNTDQEALSLIYPITTAFAMLGVGCGAIASYIYLAIYSRKHFKISNDIPKHIVYLSTKKLASFSFSIMLSCTVQSIFQFIDTASIQLALTSFSTDEIRNIISSSLNFVDISNNDLYTYVYGLFSASLDFKNIIPGITMAIGICAVPSIGSAYSTNNRNKLYNLSNLIYKYTIMLSSFCGMFLMLESNNILELFYSANQDIIVGSSSMVKLFGLTAFAYSLAGTSVFCVQAIGKPKKSIMPYVVSGIVRLVLNMTLITNSKLNLYGAIVSGFVGYLIIFVWNLIVFIKYTKVNLSIKKCFFEPIFLVIFTMLLYKFFIKSLVITMCNTELLIIKAVIFIVIYLVCAIILGIFDIKELFSSINYKKHSQNS